MFDYDIKFVYTRVYVAITIVADSEEEAISGAWQILSEQEIDTPEPQEITVEKVGEYKW